MKRTFSIILFAGCVFFLLVAFAQEVPKRFLFNKENALDEWQEKIFSGKVSYKVLPKSEKGELSAQSNSTASGLIYRIEFDANVNPYISWKWKVSKFPSSKLQGVTPGQWIENDDYAARIYVIFPSWIFTGTECIEYIWSDDLPKGLVLTNPYFNRIKLIVVESGKENQDKWAYAERNIAEDYKMLFGRYPSRGVGAIALMTDSDNTKSSALTYYSDIYVGYKMPQTLKPFQGKEKRGLWESLKNIFH